MKELAGLFAQLIYRLLEAVGRMYLFLPLRHSLPRAPSFTVALTLLLYIAMGLSSPSLVVAGANTMVSLFGAVFMVMLMGYSSAPHQALKKEALPVWNLALLALTFVGFMHLPLALLSAQALGPFLGLWTGVASAIAIKRERARRAGR